MNRISIRFDCFFHWKIAEVLGHEQIDLTRLKKQAQINQTQIPKVPRITRTLNTLESVLKVLEEHSRLSKCHIDRLIQSVEKENPQLARVNFHRLSLHSPL